MAKSYSVSAIIENDVEVGEGSFIWYFSHVMSGVRIGRNCSIGEKTFIGKNVIIGDNVRIGNNVNLYEGAVVRNDVFIGNGATITNVRKPQAFKKAEKFVSTLIEEMVSIGANATIVGGVKVQKGSVIADGAVVNRNVPFGVFVAGNPARIVKRVQNGTE